MEQTNKKIKGSAIVGEGGEFFYALSGARRGGKKHEISRLLEVFMPLEGQKHYSIRIKIPRNNLPSTATVASELLQCINFMRKEGQNEAKKGKKRN